MSTNSPYKASHKAAGEAIMTTYGTAPETTRINAHTEDRPGTEER